MERNRAKTELLCGMLSPGYIEASPKQSCGFSHLQTSFSSKQPNLCQFVKRLKEAVTDNNKTMLKKLAESAAVLVDEKDELGQTALMFSIAYNQIDCANSLLRAGARVDETDNSGQTALHVAINKGLSKCVKFLLSKGAQWKQRDIDGVTALHLAAMHPLVKSLSLILKVIAPGEVDFQDSFKKTALHWSAAYSNVEHIQLLLRHGANICIPDKDGKTPLHWAAASTDLRAVDCLKAMLAKKPSIVNWQDYEGRSALHLAVLSGTMKAIDHLVQNEYCSINILDNWFYTPLHLAAKQGLICKLSLLLNRGADHKSADVNGATAMHYAAYYNHVEAVKVLFSRSYVTDISDLDGRTAVIWAAARQSDEVIEEMAKFGINLNHAASNGCTALHAAALNGHFCTVKLLLGLEASAKVRDKSGMTPFLRACAAGKGKVAELFLQYKRSSYGSARDKMKRMGIHWAAKAGCAYLCQLLVRYGYPFNVQDFYGMTPLHYATIKGHKNCVLVLLDAKANPNITDREGKTPFHWAALCNNLEIAKALYNYEAFINAMALNEKWMTPLDSAVQLGSIITAQFLRGNKGLTSSEIRCLAARKLQNWFLMKKKCRRRCHAMQHEESTISRWNENFTEQQFEMQAEDSHDHHHIFKCSSKNLSNQLSSEEKAALMIQKSWRSFLVRKRMLNMRENITSTFLNIEYRREAEKKWKKCLENFMKEL